MDRCEVLRNMITSTTTKGSKFLLEAHNGLSARIVEDAGFEGVWASGFSIASSLGVRDCNEVSWSQVVDVVEFMNDTISIPILFDGDSGFGNFNSVRRVVKKISSCGVAGIAIEDKQFPKINSFANGRQMLAKVDEQCGKIKAAKDNQANERFSVVARTEALIARKGIDEALDRASAYFEAGADAIFIHSKNPDGKEILEFGRLWNKRCPLVVAPTTYVNVNLSDLENVGVKLYICANHMMRASVRAMKKVSEKIVRLQSISELEEDIVSVNDIFELLNYEELERAELNYLK